MNSPDDRFDAGDAGLSDLDRTVPPRNAHKEVAHADSAFDQTVPPRNAHRDPAGRDASFDQEATMPNRHARRERGELRVGDVVLKRYELLEKLGSGAMGVVFRCRDQVSGVEYALKMVPPELSRDAEAMEDVRENFQLVHGLKHPNVAGVDFLDRDEFGAYFLIMEYVRGTTLAQWIKRKWRSGRPDPGEVSGIVTQIAAALDYAHGQGVLHRDVKPANVMVNEKGVVNVLDFGLASKVRNSLSMLSVNPANTGGTPGYLAPEQFKGRYPSPAADQYALAVLAYQMLSGHLPFESDDYIVLRNAVVGEAPEPVEGISDAANRCLLKALGKDPKTRYASCTEFANGLTDALKTNEAKKLPSVIPLGPGADKHDARPIVPSFKPARPVAPDKLFESAAPVRPVVPPPVRPVASAKPAEQAKPVRPVAPAKPAEQAKSVVTPPVRPVAPAKPAVPAIPAAKTAPATPAASAERDSDEKQRGKRVRIFVFAFLVLDFCLIFWTFVGGRNGRRDIEPNPVALMPEEAADFTSAETGAGRFAPSTRTVTLPGNVKMELVKVEAGTFEMSAKDGENEPNEVPHQATLRRDFYLAKTEATQAQWKAVMGTNPSSFKGDDLPVENVSWNDAMSFCGKLNDMGKAPKGWKFTLPTETQWEFAARGGKKSRGYKYSGSDSIDEVAWYDGNSGSKTHPVGQKKANELGLYDMSGNVWECCLDNWKDDSSRLTAEFTRGNDHGGSLRADRGGSWSFSAWFCRSGSRIECVPGSRIYYLGFRVALVPEKY